MLRMFWHGIKDDKYEWDNKQDGGGGQRIISFLFLKLKKCWRTAAVQEQGGGGGTSQAVRTAARWRQPPRLVQESVVNTCGALLKYAYMSHADNNKKGALSCTTIFATLRS